MAQSRPIRYRQDGLRKVPTPIVRPPERVPSAESVKTGGHKWSSGSIMSAPLSQLRSGLQCSAAEAEAALRAAVLGAVRLKR